MLDFNFYNPTRIIFGQGKISTLSTLIDRSQKVLIVYGGGSIKKNGVYDQVKSALKDYSISEFGGIEPNPTYETLMKAVELIKKEKIDFILAVGGGSVIDGSKFLAAAAVYEGSDPWNLLAKGEGFNLKNAIAFGSILTLPATGSEMNSGAVITKHSTQDKLFFGHEKVYPKFSILDPQVTLSLDKRQMSNGIVDAFVHVIEQYITEDVNSPIQNSFSEGILKTLITESQNMMKNPTNIETRGNIMWASTLALNGLIGAGVKQDWSTHMIGHELTALHGIDHARTLALVLPSNLRLRKVEKREKLLMYAKNVWGISGTSEDNIIDQAIQKTEQFFNSLEVPTKLSNYKISKEHIPFVIEKLKKHGMVQLGERKNVTPEVATKILEMAI